MMRGWLKNQLIDQLLLHLKALGPDKSDEDRQAIDTLESLIRGDKKDTRNQGTLLDMIASMAARDSGGT